MRLLRQSFGLQKINHRYSASGELRGSKLNSVDLNRTRSLKFRKINQIKSARSHLSNYCEEPKMIGETEIEDRNFFVTHTKLRKGKAERHSRFDSPQFMVEPISSVLEEPQKISAKKLYFYSTNLNGRKNFYMNNLLHLSEEEHKIKLVQIETKMNELQSKTSTNSQNLFWRKMRRFKSYKKSQQQQQKQLTLVKIPRT